METQILEFKEEQYNSEVKKIALFIPALENAINIYNTLNLGELDQDETRLLFLQPEQFLFEKIMKDVPLSGGGFKMTKEKAFENLEKPKGYHLLLADLNNLITKVTSNKRDAYGNETMQMFLQNFSFNNVGKVEILPAVLDAIKTKHEVTTNDPSIQKMFLFAQKLEALLNEFSDIKQLKNPISAGYGLFLCNLIPLDSATGKRKVNVNAVVSYGRQS